MEIRTLAFWLICLCPLAQLRSEQPPQNAVRKTRLVVVGDSLSAGVQNFSLLGTQQPKGYAYVIAKQAGWPMTLPLVPDPGAPNVLKLISLGPPPVIEPAQGSLLAPRVDPYIQPTDIAVPGLTVGSALTLRPSLNPAGGPEQWATIVLGFPSLLQGRAPTQVELAKKLRPNVLIEWLGNNDALVPALIGQISALTPVDEFANSYKRVLDSLAKNGVKLITATIPDVTEVPYFTSAQTIAAQTGLPLQSVPALLGIGPDDFVRPSAAKYIDEIFTGIRQPPLPADCPAPLPDLGVSTLPCVLTAADANTIRNAVNCYNQVIAAETFSHAGILVDIHALVDRIYSNGYQLGDRTLTTDFLGGLFSLDGIHPTDTGYGVIANEFIRTMNLLMRTNIPQANIAAIFAADPLAKDAHPVFIPRQPPGSAANFCPAP